MGWLQLTIGSDASHVEEIGDLLQLFGADAVSYQPESREAVFGDARDGAALWDRTAVTALLDESIDLDILLVCLRNRIGGEHIHHHRVRPLAGQSWADSHKTGHRARVYNGRLCVCPSWCTPPPGDTALLRLDPGLAFGSGSHATTALCLEWLAGLDLTGRTVIDYGCGSGILGLAAAALGARQVRAVDIDPQALTACRENAVNNRFQDGVTVTSVAEMDRGPVDVLVANILLNPLLELAPVFHRLLEPGGRLALSGILASQVESCREHYRQWFELEPPRFEDEWALLCGVSRPPVPA